MSALASDLSALLGSRSVSTTDADRAAVGRDQWPRIMLGVPEGAAALWPPDVVVWPETTEQVAKVVRYAGEHEVPIVPYGAGSGVCGGALAIKAGIVIDMKRMARVISIDGDDHLATAESGILGQHLEERLGRAGYTLGHFPSSIYCSTLGGWIAARSAGQASSRYGKIEDMVQSMQVVAGTGDVVELHREQQPDWMPLFVGSEGTFGVITRSRLRIWPAPEVRLMRGYAFDRVATGLEAMRRMMQLGLRPAVVRLYDELDTQLSGLAHKTAPTKPAEDLHLPPGWLIRAALTSPRLANRAVAKLARLGVVLIVGFEGPRLRAEAEAALGHSELVLAGGRDLGEGPGLHWLAHRYRVSYQQSPLYSEGVFVDTMEVATTWDRLERLHAAVKAAIGRHALVMAHFSHAYPEGCSIYFSFVGRHDQGARERYDRLWNDALTAAVDAGSTISHHHGVGLMKAPFMAKEHGQAMDLLREVKRSVDPKGILNPGKLGF